MAILPQFEGLMGPHRDIGIAMRKARIDAGVTMKNMAVQLGCHVNMVADYERGRRKWEPEMPKIYKEALAKCTPTMLRSNEYEVFTDPNYVPKPRRRYPWKEMEVGSSFMVPCSDAEKDAVAASILSSGRRHFRILVARVEGGVRCRRLPDILGYEVEPTPVVPTPEQERALVDGTETIDVELP